VLCLVIPMKLLLLQKGGQWFGYNAIMLHKLPIVPSQTQKTPEFSWCCWYWPFYMSAVLEGSVATP
jgi:hypothetical protein